MAPGNLRFKPSSNHNHPITISRERRIVRQQVDPLAHGLRDQQAVEWVAVVEGEVVDGGGVVGGDRLS